MAERNQDNILARVDSSRRGFLRRVLGASFAAPVVATFAIETASSNLANAQQITNQSACAYQFDGEDIFLTFFDLRADPNCNPGT
jgi:hypothetical protein